MKTPKILVDIKAKIAQNKSEKTYFKSLSDEDKKLFKEAKKALRIKRKHMPPHVLNVWFGVPGSGKTTFAAWLAKKDLKYGIDVWSNTPITGCIEFNPQEDIGKYMISNGHVIIDEAGIEYDSRNFKNFTK
ncbi:MAG: hypothetical protein Q4E60_11370, partial [Bacteroidales bacterium]|nr:hypothetical protein [Bacteroidales bacterium]